MYEKNTFVCSLAVSVAVERAKETEESELLTPDTRASVMKIGKFRKEGHGG
jgi:hypothetical protein